MTANTCDACDFVHGTTRSLSPYRWRCARSPQALEGPDDLVLVAPDWRPDAPFTLCKNVRAAVGPTCPEYEPRRMPAL